MLTSEAMRERDWRGFPLLRELLENRPPPADPYSLLPSTAESTFERLARLIRITVLAEEYRRELLAKARGHPSVRHALAEELQHLRQELDALRHAWDREISAAESLVEAVWQDEP